MADFQPRFVDLVRNYTTTVGTGDFALGAAVNGFRGFAAALKPGDSFYYSAVGVDKPAETEVGRGTLLASGGVSRDPIGGTKTNFTTGTKTVALVAAAEWFDKMAQAAGSPRVGIAATRAELAAADPAATAQMLLSESGRSGRFRFDAADRSADVTADPRQGLHVAPAADPTGKSGAWVREFDGAVNVRWFGATGDGTSDDGAAFTAALAALKARAVNASGSNKGSAALSIPAGHYFLGTTTIDISHSLRVEGDQGYSPGPATKLRWSAGATGIRIQYYDTSGASSVDAVPQGSGGGTELRNLYLQGAYSGMASEAECHGVHAKVSFFMDQCWVENFQGDGLHVAASAGGSGATEGNANVSRIANCRFAGNRAGIAISGADANACLFTSVDVSDNRTWGVDDNSFLGNTYVACHAANNGLGTGITPTIVSFNGNRYCVKAGSANASTNAPSGTASDNADWVYISPGAADIGLSIPDWTSGIAVREGGPYKTANANAQNLFLGCYTEQGAPSQFVAPTLSIGGAHNLSGMGARVRSYAGYALFDRLMVAGEAVIQSPETRIGAADGSGQDSALYLDNDNGVSEISFRSKGVRTGRLLSNHPYGILFDAEAGKAFYVNNANATTCTIDGTGIDLNPGKVVKVAGTKVLGAQGAAVPDAAGGATVDSEARAAINGLLAQLRSHGLIAA